MSKIEKIENYHPNGMLSEKGVLKDGKVFGEWIYCYESGEKNRVINFDKNGKPLNIIKWYKNGQKAVEFTGIGVPGKAVRGVPFPCYPNECKIDESTTWYKNGQKRSEGNWKDGKQDGLSTSWYESGKKEYEIIFKDGELISQKCWDEDGNECVCSENWGEGCQ